MFQTLEAIFSLLVFIALTAAVLQNMETPKLNDSVYRLQLAQDAWRVLYLNGNLKDFSEVKRDKFEEILDLMSVETGLCYFIDGMQYTNCRGGEEEHEKTVALTRTVVVNGFPKEVSFSYGK